MLRVQREQCKTCPFRKSSPLHSDLPRLIDLCREKDLEGRSRKFFRTFRVCHSSRDACCAGFWVHYKHLFSVGQVAQRLDLVRYVQDNVVPLELEELPQKDP